MVGANLPGEKLPWLVKVDENDLAEVKRTLIGIKNGYPKVVTRSLNNTLKGVRTDAVREIQKVITPKAKVIRKTFKFKKANYQSLDAAVISVGGPLPLFEYAVKQTKKGVTVRVKKGRGKRSFFPGAFVATMPSGHKGVFSRAKPPYRTNRSNKIPWKRFAKRQYRLPIEQLYGPRVPDILENATVMEPILKKAWDRLEKELERQVGHEMY